MGSGEVCGRPGRHSRECFGALVPFAIAIHSASESSEDLEVDHESRIRAVDSFELSTKPRRGLWQNASWSRPKHVGESRIAASVPQYAL